MVAVAPPRRADSRGHLVGRNYDWATADLRWCELHRYDPPRDLRRIGYTHRWAGCTDLLNECGLYVAIASLPARPVIAPGVQWNIVVDMISQCCTTVQQAVTACASVRHIRAMSYLLADAGGALAVVEASPSLVQVRGPDQGLVIAANAAQGGLPLRDYRPCAAMPPIAGGTDVGEGAMRRARRRIDRAALMLRALATVRDEDVVRVLRDHEAPICVGAHDVADGGTWATIWSGLCEPAEGTFLIAPGRPCEHRYQSFRIA